MPIKHTFLVGCPRSGTTLLQCLLGAHSHIHTFPETALFYKTVPSQSKAMKSLGIASRAAKSRFREFLEEIERPELFEHYFHTPITIKQYVAMWVQLLDDLTMEEGKTVWLEKTPHHVDYLPYIHRYIPDAKIVHIIRNGPDNIASMWEQVQKARNRNGEGWSLDETVNRWITAVRASASRIGDDGHFFILYEDVAENPEVALKEILSFMDMPYEHAILERYPEVARSIVLPQEEWKAGVSGPVKNANGMKFTKLFTEKEREYILEKIKQVQLEDVPRFAKK